MQKTIPTDKARQGGPAVLLLNGVDCRLASRHGRMGRG